ncbi:MAG: CpXC domain-containing protein [Elusimicrobiales bacterium]
MSIENIRNVRCPYCKEDFEAKFWTVVRGDVDLELKDMILRGDFNSLLCPHCSKIFFYEDNFIYLDPKNQLLVFVMPSYEKEKKEIIEKLESDYELLKENLNSKTDLNFEPWYLFGTAELKDLLERDKDIGEETEVIEEICREKNIKYVVADKNAARRLNIPFSIPYKKTPHRYDIIDTVRMLLEENPALIRLKNLVDLLEEDEEGIEFIDEDKTSQ